MTTAPCRTRRRRERGTETLQAVLVVGFVLMPVLVSIVTFGSLIHAYIATQAAAAVGARAAGTAGGFGQTQWGQVQQELQGNGVDAGSCNVTATPGVVQLGAPISVTVECPQRIGIPLLFDTDVQLSSTYIARGEVNQ